MSLKFEVLEAAAQSVISIRTRCSVENLPKVLGEAYGAIMNYLNEVGIQPSGAPFTGYFNMDMQDMDIEIGFPVAQHAAGQGNIQPGEIPAGKQAACLYTGSYRQIEPAYTAMMDWITANGYKWTGICYEFYLNDPAVTPEDELQTRIVCYLE